MKRFLIVLGIALMQLAAIAGAIVGAGAQEVSEEVSEAASQEEATPPPPCSAAPYTDFAFWVGAWDVYDASGETFAGHNEITLEEGGCLMVERWAGAGGSTGQSYNFYDPLAGAWRQVWVSPGVVIDYSGGLDEEGRMVLEGEIAYRVGGRVTDFRGTWTPQDDGSVIQAFEEFNEETGEWTDWFTGLYRPAETGGGTEGNDP